MNTFNLKETVQEYKHWNSFKFEVKYSKSGVARIYINDRKTNYTAGGYGYDKESSVIASMINDLTVKTKYKKDVYGHSKGFLMGGSGFSSISESFNTKNGNRLTKLYSGLDSDIYEITINPRFLDK